MAMSLTSKFMNNVSLIRILKHNLWNCNWKPEYLLKISHFIQTTIKDNVESLLEIIRIYCQRDLPPPPEMIQFIVGMGFDEATAREALKITKNHQSNACEWLVGDRSKINQYEQSDGLPSDSPILAALLCSPHVQLSLSNPKIFIGKFQLRRYTIRIQS